MSSRNVNWNSLPCMRFMRKASSVPVMALYFRKTFRTSQIASAIAAGVSNATYTNSDGGIDENALYNVFVRALNDSADSGDIYLDGEVIYRSVRKHNDMNTRMTGVNAFA